MRKQYSAAVVVALCAAMPAIAQETAAQLPEVVVSDSALREVLSPGVVSVVRPDDTKGEHKSLPELLDQIPGVFVRRLAGTGHYTTASIRGSAPTQVNVYIDGIPVNTSSETAADLSTISMSNVERVEVYRGVTPARFSGAPLGGAINIVTKKPQAFSGTASVGARDFNGEQYSATLNFPLHDGHMLIGFDKDRSTGNFKYTNYTVGSLDRITYTNGSQNPDGLPDSPRDHWLEMGECNNYAPGRCQYPEYQYRGYTSDRRTRQNNRFDKQNAFLKWQNENFIAKYAYTGTERYIPTGIPSTSYSYSSAAVDVPGGGQFYKDKRRTQDIAQNEFLLGWRNTFNDDIHTSVNLSWLDRNQRFRNLDYTPTTNYIGERWTDYRTRRYGISGDLMKPFGVGSGVEHLFELHLERYWETLYTDISGWIPSSDFIKEYSRIMTRLQMQNTMSVAALGGLQITPVFRMEKLQGPIIGSRWSPLAGPTGEYDWSPTGSLSLKKQFASGWQVYGNYGNYHRYPSFYEIYGDGIGTVPGADSNSKAIQLKRETGTNGDIGFGWDGRLGEKWSGGFRLTAFRRKAKDAITLYSTPIAAKYINSGDTLTKGVELEGKLAWGNRASLQFAVTRQSGEYINGGWYYFGGTSAQQRYPGQKVRVRNIPDLAANARLDLHFLNNSLTAYIEGHYTGRTYIDVATWENPLTIFNLGAHYKLAKGWKLSGGVTDIFNAGPKQTLDGNGQNRKYRFTYYTCPDPTPVIPGTPITQCLLGLMDYDRHEDVFSMKHNVFYPQQGRTWYATLAYTF
ncbi:MAG: TonB-dependent receptor [Azoarcus sp.]|jgi:outer membrane cobalamin receptor|nr:TonB-dependent receptor [Azoarcus sp.]